MELEREAFLAEAHLLAGDLGASVRPSDIEMFEFGLSMLRSSALLLAQVVARFRSKVQPELEAGTFAVSQAALAALFGPLPFALNDAAVTPEIRMRVLARLHRVDEIVRRMPS